MARNEYKTDLLGNRYVQHYDDYGCETGISVEKRDLRGNVYIQHYDNTGREKGRSEVTDFFGNREILLSR